MYHYTADVSTYASASHPAMFIHLWKGQPLSFTLSFGEIPWYDENGEIRRCDWTENAFLCMCPVCITRLWVPLQPIRAPYFPLLIKPRNFAKRQCKRQWL